jgi:hypothetical protein
LMAERAKICDIGILGICLNKWFRMFKTMVCCSLLNPFIAQFESILVNEWTSCNG